MKNINFEELKHLHSIRYLDDIMLSDSCSNPCSTIKDCPGDAQDLVSWKTLLSVQVTTCCNLPIYGEKMPNNLKSVNRSPFCDYLFIENSKFQ